MILIVNEWRRSIRSIGGVFVVRDLESTFVSPSVPCGRVRVVGGYGGWKLDKRNEVVCRGEERRFADRQAKATR